jgi:hypothetical protein
LNSKDISVCVWSIVEWRNQILQRRSSVIRKLGEKRLGLGFRKRAHLVYCLIYVFVEFRADGGVCKVAAEINFGGDVFTPLPQLAEKVRGPPTKTSKASGDLLSQL